MIVVKPLPMLVNRLKTASFQDSAVESGFSCNRGGSGKLDRRISGNLAN